MHSRSVTVPFYQTWTLFLLPSSHLETSVSLAVREEVANNNVLSS